MAGHFSNYHKIFDVLDFICSESLTRSIHMLHHHPPLPSVPDLKLCCAVLCLKVAVFSFLTITDKLISFWLSNSYTGSSLLMKWETEISVILCVVVRALLVFITQFHPLNIEQKTSNTNIPSLEVARHQILGRKIAQQSLGPLP